jgi:CRP/FNR family transcriptional regulator
MIFNQEAPMAHTGEPIQFLQHVPLFQGLNNRQLKKLADRFVARRYAAGEAMVTQGQGGEGFFILVSGTAEAARTRADGEKVIVNTFGSGDFFGEMALLDDEGLRTATVQATTACDCLALTRWDFLGILKEDADMAVTILQELARRFRMALDRLQ